MTKVSGLALKLIEASLAGETPARAGQLYLDALRPFGVSAIYARAYRGPGTEGEQVYSRVSPRGWESLYAERRFQDVNPLIREVRRRPGPFRWTEMTYLNQAERDFAHAVGDFGADDGLAIPCYGPHGYLGVVSLAFERLDAIPPADRAAIEISALVLHERMRSMTRSSRQRSTLLSPRERDCVAFLAEGKSDAAIADILGVAVSTVVTHLKNARAKLGARTRAQAVAQYIATEV